MQYWQREQMAGAALASARRFLGRWGDPVTCSEREDLVQEAACRAWVLAHRVRDRRRWPALVRTISRRLRFHALCRAARSEAVFGGDHGDLDLVAEPGPDAAFLVVAGVPVPRMCLLNHLDGVLACLPALNRVLLLGFYEGFSCAELGARFHLTEDCVKVRLHRSRKRLRREFEARVRAADGLDDS